MSGVCGACGADSLADRRVVEHVCGQMDARSAFDDRCPKCSGPTDPETFETIETIARCGDCGHWQAPPTSEGSSQPVDIVFPELPTLGRSLTWLPARLVPTSERKRQLLSSAIVVVVLLAGVAGALAASPLLEETPAAADAPDPGWEEYDSIVIFRNDDVQPWYETETMRAVDGVFIEEGVPVTVGVIPNPGGDLPLTEDEATCEYLGSLQEDHPGQFEMALHGYTHLPETDFYGGSEFGGQPYEEQIDRIADGDRILRECVEPSSTFIPPMNTYDDDTVRAVENGSYTTISGGTWFTDRHYDRAGAGDDPAYFETGEVRHVPETHAFEDWGAHDGGEVPLKDTETLTDEFDGVHAENGVYVQMLHYQYFTTEERLDRLRELIRHMKATGGVGFMTVEQFSSGLENGAVERTDDGWRVLEPIAWTATQDEPTERERVSSDAKDEPIEVER
ncbi:MAG: DUF2334 domain-containing protein [Halalkalicoccus sp.]